jgi:putative RecB family exonuclease
MPVYSHSRLETFENCPLKYKFRYVDGIKKDEQTVEAFLGGLVHGVLRKLFDDLQLEKLNTLDELFIFFAMQWKKAWGPNIRIVRAGMTEQNYFDFGRTCIRNFYEKYKPFGQSQTLGTEVHLTFPLDTEGKYQMQGYVDRIARRPDGVIEIHDYKTTRSLPGQPKADGDRQLALYQIGIERQWPDTRGVELIWHYVACRETLRSRRTAQQLVQLREQTIQLIDRIEGARQFEGRRSALCDWCEFKPDCPLWRHPNSVLSLPPAQFKEDDGVRLADEFAKAKQEKDAVDLRVEQLKEQLVGFARQRNLQIVKGSGVQVSVRWSEGEKFPGKREPERAALEQLLKRAGKWEDISELDAAALSQALERAHWPPELLAEIRKFATTVQRETVILRHNGKDSSDESG